MKAQGAGVSTRVLVAALMLALTLALGGCAAGSGGSADGDLRLNDIQALGSHNSYKQAIDPALMERLLVDLGSGALALDYAHPPLAEQLDLGLLKLELDVFHDPLGGRYAQPSGLAGLRAMGAPTAAYDADAMALPGFKVLHVQDVDFRSSCLTLAQCLRQLRTWSDAHPGHLPVAVSINAKQAPLNVPGMTVPLIFDAQAWDALDQEILDHLGASKLLMPDEVRGEAESLRSAILERGWPRLDDVRGRFLFVLDESMEVAQDYLQGHPMLQERVMFVAVDDAHPAAAVLILNDPLADAARIRQAVADGFIVRTRADADTQEARSGQVARRNAALASGAQYLSSDYYLADPRFSTGYQVQLPAGGSVRCNPVRRSEAGCEVRLSRPAAPN